MTLVHKVYISHKDLKENERKQNEQLHFLEQK